MRTGLCVFDPRTVNSAGKTRGVVAQGHIIFSKNAEICGYSVDFLAGGTGIILPCNSVLAAQAGRWQTHCPNSRQIYPANFIVVRASMMGNRPNARPRDLNAMLKKTDTGIGLLSSIQEEASR